MSTLVGRDVIDFSRSGSNGFIFLVVKVSGHVIVFFRGLFCYLMDVFFGKFDTLFLKERMFKIFF